MLSDRQQPAKPSAASEIQAPQGSQPQVLVVDDDPAVRMGLKLALQKKGYVVRTAETGVEAIESFGLERADIVLMDIRMPDMYGFEVSQAIKRDCEVPIIFLSGTKNEAVIEQIPELVSGAGGAAFLMKPLQPNVVTDLVSKYVGPGKELPRAEC